MNFASLTFFLLILFTVLFYYVFPKRYRWIVLLISSCYFYIVAGGIQAFEIIILSIIITYTSSLLIEKSDEDKKKKKAFLSIAVVLFLAFLAVNKFLRYKEISAFWIIMPLGISYYTFSIIGYLVDVYSKRQTAEHNIFKLALFVLFFPKIMQGPISKYREIGPKLLEGHNLQYSNICYGLQRIIWGYFKKLVIVERASLLTKNVFDGNLIYYNGGGAALIVITIIATISQYCDFSGYMDIVIGVSQMMGIELDENFRQPFFSKTAAEFWRRWHITLGVWQKDYVYMALVINPAIINIGKWTKNNIGKRVAKNLLTAIPLAIVWLVSGLWHGTGIDYIVWGLYWGSINIFSSIFSPEIKKLCRFLHIDTESADWRLIQIVRTFLIFSGGLVISTFVGVAQIKNFIWILVKDFGIGRLSLETFDFFGLDRTDFVILIVSICILFVIDYLDSTGDIRKKISNLNWFFRWGIYALLIISVLFFGIYGPEYSTAGFAYALF